MTHFALKTKAEARLKYAPGTYTGKKIGERGTVMRLARLAPPAHHAAPNFKEMSLSELG